MLPMLFPGQVMKHVVQAAIAASQVVGRAFVKAVRQEVAGSFIIYYLQTY